jgi:hypothetical protein
MLQEWMLSGGLAPVEGSPPSSPPSSSPPEPGSPISAVTSHEVAGPPTVDWHPATHTLDLGIPHGAPGAGINEVKVDVLPAGTDPKVESFAGGILTLGLSTGTPGPPGQKGSDGTQFVVAAGRFGPNGGPKWAFGGLVATRIAGSPGLYFLTCDRIDSFPPERPFVVKGTVVTGVGPPVHTFEVIDSDALGPLLEKLGDNAPNDPGRGLFVRVVGSDLKSVPQGFFVEISDFEGA